MKRYRALALGQFQAIEKAAAFVGNEDLAEYARRWIKHIELDAMFDEML